jgi:molybdate transport system ATP-binding protein
LRDQAQVPMVYISHSVPEVARLATVMAVLEAGRLKAFGPVSDVLQHADLLPASERGQASAVIDAVVDSAMPPPGLTLLRSAGNLWQVPALVLAAGARLRLRVRARDVMIALSVPDGISALNILPGRIVQVLATESGGSEVLLDCGGDRLVAQVTTVSAERLKLVPGQRIHAVVKAVAFDRD